MGPGPGNWGRMNSSGGALVCRGPGTTWGPAGGPGGRTFPGLVGVLERGVQLLEALLQRVALVVLHQLLQDVPTDCRRLQAGLPGAPAALCHLLRFTQGTPLLDLESPPPPLPPAPGPGRVAGIPKTFEPVISLPNVSEGKAREMPRSGAGVLLQPFIRRKAGTPRAQHQGNASRSNSLSGGRGHAGTSQEKGAWTDGHVFHYACRRAGRGHGTARAAVLFENMT